MQLQRPPPSPPAVPLPSSDGVRRPGGASVGWEVRSPRGMEATEGPGALFWHNAAMGGARGEMRVLW